jgi:UDP-N-acetylmuramoyl-tripeptide--D-alanyl-D-alanine ligase
LIALGLTDLAAAVGGELVDVDAGAHGAQITGDVFVDSRAPVADGLFAAIVGERADGHEFAASAVAAGAAAALVERPVGVPAVLVPDTVAALGRLARHVVAQVPGLPVVGITGSQGKTGTKDIVAQLLRTQGETVAATGSYNTEVGVPLTATRISTSTRYLVLELGARRRGHLRYLTSLVPPHVGVVLNVGLAHVGEFGSQSDIAAAKGELVEALPADGVAVLNADDPLVAAMRDRTAARVVTFGRSVDADVTFGDIRLDDHGRPSFKLTTSGGRTQVRLALVGEHQVANAAAAAAVAEALGMPARQIPEALEAVRAVSRWRMEVGVTPSGVTVINDAYNANPDSTRAALRTLAQIASRREPRARTIAVLGEMRELGEHAAAEHETAGRQAAELGVAMVVAVGDGARGIHVGATSSSSWDGESVCVPDPDAAAKLLRLHAAPGDVVLVKASRAAGLESVAAALDPELSEELR